MAALQGLEEKNMVPLRRQYINGEIIKQELKAFGKLGVRQRCSVSLFLFSIVQDCLASAIEQKNKSYNN